MFKIIFLLLTVSTIECVEAPNKLMTHLKTIEYDFANSSKLADAVSDIIFDQKSRSKVFSQNIMIFHLDGEAKNTANILISNILYQTASSTLMTIEQVGKTNSIKMKKYFNIFFIDSFRSFNMIRDQMTPKKMDYNGNYLIVVTNFYYNLIMDLDEVFKFFWKMSIVNVNVIFETADRKRVKMYTYFPYTVSNCGQVSPVLWKTFENGHFKTKKRIFPEKLKNLHDCPLNVAALYTDLLHISEHFDGKYKFSRIDGNMLEMFSERINFDINLTIMPLTSLRWGYVFENGSSGGAFKLVCR